MARNRAFSLTELLAVIAVLAVMLGLLLTALASTRRSAERTSQTASMRDLTIAVLAYSNQYREMAPILSPPGRTLGPLTYRSWRSRWDRPYFYEQGKFWITPLGAESWISAPHLRFDADEQPPEFIPIGDHARPSPLVRSAVYLSHTVAAQASYWVGANPPPDSSLLRGVPLSDARSPSNKGLLLQWADSGPLVAACDGSTKLLTLASYEALRPPVSRNGDGAIPWPVLSTSSGLRGVDW